MTDMFFADNAISTKALQKCQPFCPTCGHHFIIFFLSDFQHAYLWRFGHNDVQLLVTFQRKSTKTQFRSDVIKISWTQKPCSYSNYYDFMDR